jgi:hypothetical protein
MFNKLYQDGVEGDMWSLMNNMYKGMTFKVKWDNHLTDNITSIMACISVLGPSRTISSAHAGEATPMSPNFAPSVLIVRLLRIVLLYLLSDSMKSGILTPILKKGKDKNIPGNYRGIVVTNTFSKILESIIKDRLEEQLKKTQNPIQRGFTEKASSKSQHS